MDDDILPLLKPADWNLKDKMVCRPLAKLGARALPLVAYGYDRPNTFEILGREHRDAASPDQLDRPAREHLRARKASWETITIKLGWFKKLHFLACGDDFLAAERILLPDFLQAAQKQLRTKMLAVGIPRRGMLMACDGTNKDAVQHFCAAVAGQYHRAESPPITDTVFAAEDGKIIGHLDDGGISADLGKHLAEEADDDTIYIQTITVDAGAHRRAVICAGGEPLDKLEARIRRELGAMAAKYGQALRAEVQIIPDLTQRSAAVDAWMPAVATRLTALAAELGAAHDVTVKYGDPS